MVFTDIYNYNIAISIYEGIICVYTINVFEMISKYFISQYIFSEPTKIFQGYLIQGLYKI